MTTHTEPTGFSSLGLSDLVLAALAAKKFTTPTPIQEKAIPIALGGEDVIGIAQTGTGKTLAFGLPMIEAVLEGSGKGLVLLPTRELALQVDETLQRIGKGFGLKTACLIGGAAMHLQVQALRRNPHIVIATPGRLIDHLQQKTIGLSLVKTLVLDEADRMLDMGFAPQITKILEALPEERHTMLFSATMPAEIMAIAAKYMQKPVHVEIARAGTTADTIDQEFFIVAATDKGHLLETLLGESPLPTLVFARTKYGAKNICARLCSKGYGAAEIHSNRSLAQRKEALQGFKNGKYAVLVATDIAARGIDVSNIAFVINYDLPDSLEDYVHRIGRTGRAGREGKAISFVKPAEKRDIQAIEKLIGKQVRVSPTPSLDAKRDAARAEGREEKRERPAHNDRRGGMRPSSAPRKSRARFAQAREHGHQYQAKTQVSAVTPSDRNRHEWR